MGDENLSPELMFPFVTKPTWNPVVLYPCPHGCVYCYVPEIVEKWKIKRYKRAKEPTLLESELRRRFVEDDIVFVCDMEDLFAESIPLEFLLRVLNRIESFPKTRFLLLTKNPRRLYNLAGQGAIPKNCILGCTIESNRNYPHFSHAPPQTQRIRYMKMLHSYSRLPLFWSAEPLFEFDLDLFAEYITRVEPWGVAIGYDNHDKYLPEPPLEKTLLLIKRLQNSGLKVWEKMIRESWEETEKGKMEAVVKG